MKLIFREKYIENVNNKKQLGEVFTPIKFINNNILKDLEPYIDFSNKNLTYLDPGSGYGNFSVCLYFKLMSCIDIPNLIDRHNHILNNQLFLCEINENNSNILKKYFRNVYTCDALDINKYFDVIIGNPPYNNKLLPLYNKFIQHFIDKCNYMSFIIPSRWFSGGKGLDKFRSIMLNRNDIIFIKHFDNACDIFGNFVNIKGGVNYFLIDKNNNKGLCNFNGYNIKLNKYDVLLDPKHHIFIDNILKNNNKFITNLYIGRYFGVESNDKRLKDEYFDGSIKCYVSKQKGFIKYIDKKYITKNYDFYKVITPHNFYNKNRCFGNILIGNKDEIYSGTYISFKVNTLLEAESLVSYLKTKYVNYTLHTRKINVSMSCNDFKWIPLVPLDRIWNDDLFSL